MSNWIHQNQTNKKEDRLILQIEKKGWRFTDEHLSKAADFVENLMRNGEYNSIDHSEKNLRGKYGLKFLGTRMIEMENVDIQGSSAGRNTGWEQLKNPSYDKIKKNMLNEGVDCEQSVLSMYSVMIDGKKKYRTMDGTTRLSIFHETNAENVIFNEFEIVDENIEKKNKGTSMFQIHSNQGRKVQGIQTSKDISAFVKAIADSGSISKDELTGELNETEVTKWTRDICRNKFSKTTIDNIVKDVIRNYSGGTERIVLNEKLVERILGRTPALSTDEYILNESYLDKEPEYFSKSGKELDTPKKGIKYITLDASGTRDLLDKMISKILKAKEDYNYRIVLWANFGHEKGKTMEEVYRETIYKATEYLTSRFKKIGINYYYGESPNTEKFSFYGACPCLINHQWNGLYLYNSEDGTFDFGKN